MALQAALGPVTAALGQLQAGLGQLQAGQAAQQLTLNQLQAGQAAQQLTLNQLLAGQAAQSTLLAKLHNRQCGDGRSVPFLPVPNGAGNLVPQGLQPLHDVDAIRSLTRNQINWRCGLGTSAPHCGRQPRSAALLCACSWACMYAPFACPSSLRLPLFFAKGHLQSTPCLATLPAAGGRAGVS